MLDNIQPIDKFKKTLASYEKDTLRVLLLKTGLAPEKFKETVISEVKRNDKLLDAYIKNPKSMFASILFAAEIGLIPSETLGEFYLIPRNIKQPNGSYLPTVTPLIGYKGMVGIILRSGQITRISSEVVYEGDEFSVEYGLEPKLVHKPNFSADMTANKITHVYAVAKNINGEYQFAVMTKKQVESVKDMSRYDNDLYFNDQRNPNRWLEKKTAILQLAKLLPKDYHMKYASEMDGKLNAGNYVTLEGEDKVLLVDADTPSKPTRFRSIYETLGK
jgi:phage RecT family recombinase